MTNTDEINLSAWELLEIAMGGGNGSQYVNLEALIYDAIAEAKTVRETALEEAAAYHDSEIAKLEQQIAKNNEYRNRCGDEAISTANDFCRGLQVTHRLSAEAIRALKDKT